MFYAFSKKHQKTKEIAAGRVSAAIFVHSVKIACFISALLLIFLYMPTSQIAANEAMHLPQNEQEAQALYLRLQEVEASLKRITSDIERLQNKSQQTRTAITQVQEKRQKLKKEVFPILRSRYTVHPIHLWFKLISLNDWQMRLYTEEMLNYILKHHQNKLSYFLEIEKQMQALWQEEANELHTLSMLHAEKETERTTLQTVIAAWEAHLARQKDPQTYERTMQQFYQAWQSTAEPALDILLKRLNDAYGNMPNTFQHKVKIGRNGATFTLSDRELTDYLRTYDNIFENIDITFDENNLYIAILLEPLNHQTQKEQSNRSFTAHSKTMIHIQGHYELKDGKLIFAIDKMLYGNLLLPPEVILKLEAQYQLGIDPQRIHPRLSISNFNLHKGVLTLWFTLQL